MNTFCKRILPMCLLIMTASLAAADVSADAEKNLRTTMHKLWEDHITYTRNFIISFAGNLPDQDAVAARLMKNQEDIGGAQQTSRKRKWQSISI